MNVKEILEQHRARQLNLPDKIALAAAAGRAAIARLPDHIARTITLPVSGQRRAAYVTNHPPTMELVDLVCQMAEHNEPVLIQGESGTGKELLAKMLLGDRFEEKFFPTNCAGIPPLLFESLMFGHMRGSFTGADKDKQGLLITAGSGLVFLDEIGELPLEQQAKMLRVLQEMKVQPVGSPHMLPIKCRFVFATNRDLKKMIAAGTFREDLYYRIAALPFHTYPLRERPDDAILIAKSICQRRGWPVVEYSIPDHIVESTGNIRALENWLLQLTRFGRGKDGINPALQNNL